MSWWSAQHEQIKKDMEDGAKVDLLIHAIRDRLMKRYRRRAGALGVDRFKLVRLSASAAVMGLARALKKLGKWNHEKREFAYFVFLQARRIIAGDLDKIEKDETEKVHSLEQEKEEPAAPFCDVRALEKREELRSLLASLKPEHSQVLQLKLYGFSVAEISARLGRSYESTKSLIKRARQAAERVLSLEDKVSPGRPARDGPGHSNIIYLENHRKQRGAES